MHKILCLLIVTVLAGCSSSSGDGNRDNNISCSETGQKDFVLAAMQDWYLWNDLLPNNVNVDNHATPEALLAFLMTFSPDDGSGQPIDKFSFIKKKCQ